MPRSQSETVVVTIDHHYTVAQVFPVTLHPAERRAWVRKAVKAIADEILANRLYVVQEEFDIHSCQNRYTISIAVGSLPRRRLP